MDAVVRTFGTAANLNLNASKIFADAVSRMPGAKVTGGQLGTGGTSGGGGAAAAPAGPSRAQMAARGATTYGAAGMATGAAIGSVFGGIGAVPGAAIGGLVGSIIGAGAGALRGTPAMGTGQGPADSKKILDFIGKYESGGDYNKMVGGSTAPLTNMTVAQVMDFQRQQVAQGKGSAAGKYQVLLMKLNEMVDQGVVSPTDRFDAATQDKIGRHLLERRGYSAYKSGQLSKEQFANNLAMEWAALPMPDGKSYHAGVGNNRAGVSRADLMSVISARKGGIAEGPTSGYTATLHGTEAIVPLPDGKNIPVMMSNPALGSGPSGLVSQISETVNSLGEPGGVMVETIRQSIQGLAQELKSSTQPVTGDQRAMIAELQNIASLMARQANTSERILRVTQN
jgi:hypothetical protein